MTSPNRGHAIGGETSLGSRPKCNRPDRGLGRASSFDTHIAGQQLKLFSIGRIKDAIRSLPSRIGGHVDVDDRKDHRIRSPL